MVNVGDIVFHRLVMGDTRSIKEYKGTVIYVHPKKRFYRAEFPMECGVIREAFIIEPYKKKRRR